MMKCHRCQDARWVCENHPDNPWGAGHGECCGGAGVPCPKACGSFTPNTPEPGATVPGPSTWAMLLAGFTGLAYVELRKARPAMTGGGQL